MVDFILAVSLHNHSPILIPSVYLCNCTCMSVDSQTAATIKRKFDNYMLIRLHHTLVVAY